MFSSLSCIQLIYFLSVLPARELEVEFSVSRKKEENLKMASVLAEAVVKKVCEMAVQQATNEVGIVSNFTQDFEWLKNKVEDINCVLKEADEESARQKESVKKWLHRVRDVAWEAEDILQECAVDSKYASSTQSCTLPCNQLILRHQMGRRIQEVKTRMSSVVEDGNQLNIVRAAVPHKEEAESSRSQEQRFKRSSLLPRDSKPVGIQSKIQLVVDMLENPAIPIIAVVGMGGIGKTYLLQHVYNSGKQRYEKSAWLSVSQVYSVSKLQRVLAFLLDEDLNKKIIDSKVDEETAAVLIHRFMLGKRCLIVLDDVWRATREDDLLTKLGLPTRDNSEIKIVVSTRSKEVCTNFNAHIYEMEYLTDEESWRLFCAYAFPGSEGNRGPQHLEEVGVEIVKECGKLPLAIKTTAASLARTSQLREWQSKLSKLKKVGTSNDPVMDNLKLSYDSLPAHLKACFAYFSFFPEDEEIECDYLIYLWMGEGFIPAGENPWDCLHQLANLCLVEVWEKEWNLKKYCKIHDLLLDLAILISRENKCAFRVEDAFSKLHSVNAGGGRWCRIFLAKKDIDKRAISKRRPVSPTLVRTLSLSGNSEIGRNIPAMFLSVMRVLRVLDLSGTPISTLSACVGKMKLLQVLNLRRTGIQKIPECVRCLKSLCFLDVSHTFIIQAPKWISELKCLQHLEGRFLRMPKGISKLESLRTLRDNERELFLSMEEDGMLRLEDVGKMSEIEEIGFGVEHESQLKRMEEGILAPLLKMRRLTVRNLVGVSERDWLFKREYVRQPAGSESSLPQFPERMNATRDLEHLTLFNFAVPSWICCLANLTFLNLEGCHCSNYPELQDMPDLVSLRLRGNSSCRELPKAFGKSGGFPHLRFLIIAEFSQLEEFPEKFWLISCKKVNKVGEGLELLKRLREFNYCGTGIDVRKTFKEGGIYWKKIKTINPHITITNKYNYNY